MANSHPGSYCGQDAYSDMLVTENDIFNAGHRTVQRIGSGIKPQDEGLQGCYGSCFEGGGCLSETAQRNSILRILQETYGTKAVCEWGTGVLELVQSQEVLQYGLHESGIPSETKDRDELDGSSLPCPTLVAGWIMRDMRKQQKCRCTSQGWESTEQQPGQSSEVVPELPYKSTSSCKKMFDMWKQGKGIRLLQQALYQIQKIRRSALCERTKGGDCMKDVSTQRTAVRRLTPL